MPSSSEKQRRFMGAELARKRAGKKTQTGMSESQLSDFAGSVHGSLEDIDYHENAAETDTLCDEFTHPIHKGYSDFVYGELDPPAHDGSGAAQFTKGKQSCNRDIGQGLHYGAPVDYFGPDTDYRAEELNVHQYGRDYEPFPLRDYFKDQKKGESRPNLRLIEEFEYEDVHTPGTVEEKNPMTEAYGARNYQDIEKHRDNSDHRSFESQERFRRNMGFEDEDRTSTGGLDTKRGKNIR